MNDVTIAGVAPIEVAERERAPVTHRQTVFDVRDLTVRYGRNPALHAQAWAAALVLMSFVLAVSVLSKAVLARSRRKLSR